MSYCVNCGVELDDSAKKCALCHTPVYVPNSELKTDIQPPFSDNLTIPEKIKRKFIAGIISMVILIPNIVLFLVNVFFFRQSFWSVYVFSSSFLAWTLFVFPFCTDKVHPYLLWASDTLVASAYIYVFFVMKSQQPWILKTTFSIILLVSLFAFVFLIWSRKKKKHWTAIVAHIFFDLMLLSLIAGTVATVLSDLTVFLTVGLICSVCFFALFCFFLYCNRSKRVRALLNKAFFI